jgi:adiponectin receptor
MCHSQSYYLIGMQLDLLGILLLMTGSVFPLVHYTFPCQFGLQAAYLTATTALAALCAAATLLPAFRGPQLGRARAALFASFALVSFAAPLAHGAWAAGWAEEARRVGLSWIGVTAGCNGLGVVAYSLKVGNISL